MSGATEASSVLQAAAERALSQLSKPVTEARDARYEMNNVTDLVDVMGYVADAILACEALHGVAKRAEADLRLHLARSMADTGAQSILTPDGYHSISLRAAIRGAIIEDRNAIPAELFSTPEPKPDLVEIAKRLRSGVSVPGAVLSNGGEQTIQIRKREAA